MAAMRGAGALSIMFAAMPSRMTRKELPMLYTIALVLLILWALGLVTSVTMGGLVHALLVIAVIVVIFQLVSGRKIL
jgi:fatty acid desaturase